MEAAVAVVQEEQQQQQHHELAPQLQFPPGYHFVPTELELLGYLRGKIEGQELPLAVVNEVAILDWQPGSLVEAYKGYGESKWYFFTVREPSSSNKEEEPNRKVRVPGVKATWKATGSVAPIVAAAGAMSKQQLGEGGESAAADGEEEKVIVGTKRVLIYQSSDAEEDGKWSMHEYILKGHSKIGQYALCSIQRKQHSDIVDDAGEGSSSRRKSRTKAANADDPGKAKRRRTKKPPTEPEGLQLQQLQETASSVEAPLKLKSKTMRTAAKGQQQKQQDQEVASFNPATAPLAPPQEAPPQALQQSAPLLPAAPLQGYTSSPTKEGTHADSFQYDDDMLLSDLDLDAFMKLCEKTEQQPHIFTDHEFITGSHGQYQQQDYHSSVGVHDMHHYPEPQPFPGDFFTRPDNSSWNHGHLLQNYQQEIGGASFAAPGVPHHADARYHGQSPYEEVQYYSSSLAETVYRSPDRFMGSADGAGAASGSDGGIGMGLTEAELFAMDALRDDDPLDCVGAQGGSNDPEPFQSQDEALQLFAMDALREDDPLDCVGAQGGSNDPEPFQSRDEPPLRSSCGQQQHAATGHGCDGPPPSRSVSEFWERR